MPRGQHGAERARRRRRDERGHPPAWWPAPACWRTTATPTTSTCFPWSRAAPPAPTARPSCSPPTAATPTTRAARSSCRTQTPAQDNHRHLPLPHRGARRRDRDGDDPSPHHRREQRAGREPGQLCHRRRSSRSAATSSATTRTSTARRSAQRWSTSSTVHFSLRVQHGRLVYLCVQRELLRVRQLYLQGNDGRIDGNKSTVSLTVNPVNDAPVANADSFATDEDIAPSGDVLGNDRTSTGDAQRKWCRPRASAPSR